MISIIISSADKALLSAVSQNIALTVGVPYQLIAIDNSSGQKGICQVYNEGLRQANYDIICFMHEDIELLTEGWGQIVVDIFKANPEVGLIGVAGGGYKPLAPSGWHGLGVSTEQANILQGFKYSDRETNHYYCNPNNEKLARVACLDGVWLCTTKKIALANPFDENFTGFHVYDLDISLTIGQKHKVMVTYDVLMRHFSEGGYRSVSWLEDTIKLHQKWAPILPVNLAGITKAQMTDLERRTFKSFLDQSIRFKLPVSKLNGLLWKDNRFVKLSVPLFLKLQFYVVQRWFKTVFVR